MRIVVVFGSERGEIDRLARTLGATLRRAGHIVAVQPVRDRVDLTQYDAVLLGGALSGARWNSPAVRFVRRHLEELRRLPVWFFSSGAFGSADTAAIAPPAQVQRLMAQVGALGHRSFGARLDAGASRPVAREQVASERFEDLPELSQATAWAEQLVRELERSTPRTRDTARARSRATAWRVLSGLCLFTAITALLGGVELMGWPEGAPWLSVPIRALEQTPFSDFTVPGFLLFVFVGLLSGVSTWLLRVRSTRAPLVAAISGSSLSVYIVVEMVLLRSRSWIETLYLAIGLTTAASAMFLWRARPPPFRSEREQEDPTAAGQAGPVEQSREVARDPGEVRLARLPRAR